MQFKLNRTGGRNSANLRWAACVKEPWASSVAQVLVTEFLVRHPHDTSGFCLSDSHLSSYYSLTSVFVLQPSNDKKFLQAAE